MHSRLNQARRRRSIRDAWGAARARFLKQELALQGFVVKEPYTEDWGYAIEIENPAFNLWIGCGNYQEYPDGFLCHHSGQTVCVEAIPAN
jgi:hypothetical protein